MAETVIMPKLGFDMSEGTLIRWVLAEGQPVTKGAVLAEIETDKATVEVESNFDGIIAKHLVEQGTVVPVNTPIAIVTKPGEQVANEQLAVGQITNKPMVSDKVNSDQAVSEKPATPSSGQPVKASPIAKRFAHEKGLDLTVVTGSGPGGRIVKRDVETYQPPIISLQTSVVTPSIAQPVTVAHEGSISPGRTVPLTKLRTAIARRMVEAKQRLPHFYITHDYDMAALMALRKQVNAVLSDAEKVSINDFIVKAVALSLRQFPNLNASFVGDGLQGSNIIQHGAVNIGIAVSVEGGLLTIVCRDADQKPLKQIAGEVKTLIAHAREGKVRPEDIEGSTFSISNLGMYDVEQFVAIINPPEAAILAVGSVKEVPVVKDGQLTVGTRMKATISVDHRISDGAEAAQFLQALAKFIEEPLRLML